MEPNRCASRSAVSPLVVAIACVCGACSGLRPGTAVHYDAHDMATRASVALEVESNGAARVVYTSGEPPKDVAFEAKVTPEELAGLASTLRQNDFCSLEATNAKAQPGATIAVRLEDIDCSVQLPDADWRVLPRAAASIAAVRSVADAVEERGGSPAPASNLAPGTALHYGWSYIFGSFHLEIGIDGTTLIEHSGKDQGQAVEVGGKATPAELEALRQLLLQNNLCSLHPKRSTAALDEPRLTLSVRLKGLDCSVELFDGEWRESPRADRSMKAVEALAKAIEERATPP